MQFLKSQSKPQYSTEVTESIESENEVKSEFSDSGDDLYNQVNKLPV